MCCSLHGQILTTLLCLTPAAGCHLQGRSRTRAAADLAAAAAAAVHHTCCRFATSKDEAAQEMLLCLVERLGHEQEVGWLDSIAQELVGGCDALLDNPGVSVPAVLCGALQCTLFAVFCGALLFFVVLCSAYIVCCERLGKAGVGWGAAMHCWTTWGLISTCCSVLLCCEMLGGWGR
jgi:hypothetical protein